MKNNKGNFMKIVLMTLVLLVVISCSRESDIASENLSRSADEFGINRRIVFYNGVTGEYILTIEGLCSLGNYDTAHQLSVTCKDGHNSYKKHFLGLSDNVTYFAEQINSAKINGYHYKVIFKPASIIPDVDIR